MGQIICSQCGAPIDASASECKFCGEKLEVQQAEAQQSPFQQFEQSPFQQVTFEQTPFQQSSVQQITIQRSTVQQTMQVGDQPVQQTIFVQQPITGINPTWPIKSKTAAGLLAIFLGGLGIHKFYLGKPGLGILYLLFCWTYIPEIVGFIEGIIYLCSNDENFQLKHHVRIK